MASPASEYSLYDEDYSPAEDQDESRLWPVVAAIVFILMAWALKPLWVSEFKRYVAIYRHQPDANSEQLTIPAESAHAIHETCEHITWSGGAANVVIANKKGEFVAQVAIRCDAVKELLR